MENDDVGVACSAYGGGERRIDSVGGETWGKRNDFGDPGVDGRITLS